MTIFIIDVLIISVIIFVALRERRRYGDRLCSEAQARLDYIHILIDTVYTYGNNHELLSVRLKQEMSAKKLLLYGIIERKQTEACRPELKINEDDRLLYQLLQEGFSPRELCIVFSLNNLNSLYVKHHRIRKKLGLLSEATVKTESEGEAYVSEQQTQTVDEAGKKHRASAERICKDKADPDPAEKEKTAVEA